MKTFKINGGCFDYTIYFVISEVPEKVIKFVNLKLGLPNKEALAFGTSVLAKRNGVCFDNPGYCPVIWLPKEPETPDEYGVLFHEVFHAVCHLTRWAEIPLTESSEETCCHLIKYLVKQALTKMKSK